MVEPLKVDFQAPGPVQGGDLVVFVGDDLKPAPAAAERIGPDAVALIARAAAAEQFKGKAWSAMTLAAPSASPVDRMIVVGIGGEKDRAGFDWAQLGGIVAGKSPAGTPRSWRSSRAWRPRLRTLPTSRWARGCAITVSTATRPGRTTRKGGAGGDPPDAGGADPAAARRAHKLRDGLASA